MTKYFCLCGMHFKKKRDAAAHSKYMESEHSDNDESIWMHRVFKRNLIARIMDNVENWPLNTFMRASGYLIVYFTLKAHFNIEVTMLEGALMGFGMGLVAINE